MKEFVTRLILFLTPFLLAGSAFFMYDPFKILYDHGEEMFVADGTIDGFTLNRDIVGTEMFLKRKDSLDYDAMIFGSSRASAFLSRDWETHIDNAYPAFHFIGSGESLFGIWKKLQFLKKEDHKINYALISVDHESLSKVENGKGVIGIRDRRTAGQSLEFFLTHFAEYISTDFFVQYLDFKFFKTQRGYMDKLFDNSSRGLVFDNYKNDWIHQKKEDLIKADSVGYYSNRKAIFYQRSSELNNAPQVLLEKHKKYLKEMFKILEDFDCNYNIVINPLYDQKKLNSEDLMFLNEVFGADKIHDFSGQNDMTNEAGHYYESSHFKPFIGNRIIEQIYNHGKD